MSDDTPPKPKKRASIQYLLWNVASLDHHEVSAEEVAYFRDHPDQIDEVSSPLVLHRVFLWIGLIVGAILMAVSKALSHGGLVDALPPWASAFIVDMVFEVGAALIGAAMVTFMISLALNQQQARAKQWRKEIRRRIRAPAKPR